MTLRQIIALGGGGFSMEPDNPLLDEYVLHASGKAKPKICFIGTASRDAESYAYRFHKYMKRFTRKTSVLRVAESTAAEARKHLLAQDIVYVGGGNTMHMLAVWKEHGTGEILREAYERGIVLAGISAGSICWFDWGLTDSIPGQMTPIKCLGFLSGGNCVHYDGERDRRPAFQREIAGGRPAGIAADDGVALHYVDGTLQRIVSSRPDARAWRVEATYGVARETMLQPEYLRRPGPILRRAASCDVEGIHDTHHASIRGLAAKDYTPEQIAAWTGRIMDAACASQILDQIRSETMWVVEVDGRVEAYLHLRQVPDLPGAGYLHALYVSPKGAGKGFGRKLVQTAEIEAERRGLTKMALHSSLTALRFYERQGYTPTGPQLLHHVAGVSLPCVPMTKLLGTPTT